MAINGWTPAEKLSQKPKISIDINDYFRFHCIYVSNRNTFWFFSVFAEHTSTFFLEAPLVALADVCVFFFNSVVSAAVACAFNFSRFFLCFCCFVLLLVHAANLIWYAPHDECSLSERCLCCWNAYSFHWGPAGVCVYCCYCCCCCGVCFFFCSVRTDWPHLQPCLCSHRTTFRVQSPAGKKAADILATNTLKKSTHTQRIYETIEKRKLVSCYMDVICCMFARFFFSFSQHLLVTGFSVQKPLDEPYKRYYGVFHAHVIYYFIQWPFSIVHNVVRI